MNMGTMMDAQIVFDAEVAAAKKRALVETERRDLDETRRLLYIAIHNEPLHAISGELAGTLVHALVHHSKLCTHEEAAGLVADFRHGSGAVADSEWLQRPKDAIAKAHALIAEITERLGA